MDEAHEENESDDGGDTEEGERLVINELQEDSVDFDIEMNNIPEETGESRMQTFAISQTFGSPNRKRSRRLECNVISGDRKSCKQHKRNDYSPSIPVWFYVAK